jgi:hypothetical protein
LRFVLNRTGVGSAHIHMCARRHFIQTCMRTCMQTCAYVCLWVDAWLRMNDGLTLNSYRRTDWNRMPGCMLTFALSTLDRMYITGLFPLVPHRPRSDEGTYVLCIFICLPIQTHARMHVRVRIYALSLVISCPQAIIYMHVVRIWSVVVVVMIAMSCSNGFHQRTVP